MKMMYSVLFLGVGLSLSTLSSVLTTSAQPLSKDIPTGNLTEDIDIVISPTEQLPANGTMTISTEGSTDMDINEFPPPGVSVIIQNDKVVVTNKTITYQ